LRHDALRPLQLRDCLRQLPPAVHPLLTKAVDLIGQVLYRGGDETGNFSTRKRED